LSVVSADPEDYGAEALYARRWAVLAIVLIAECMDLLAARS
jgi:hypothetical protein